MDAVRAHDRPAYLSGLLMPDDSRRSFFALRAFNLELVRVREAVHKNEATAMLRFQWWREFVHAAYAPDAGPVARLDGSSDGSSSSDGGGSVAAPASVFQHSAHPLFGEFRRAVQRHDLTRRFLDRLIDARQEDFALQQPETLQYVEAYADATAASMMYLSLEMLGVRDEAADHAASHAGKAMGIATLLNGMPFLVAAGQNVVPRDLMRKHGLRAKLFARLSEVAVSPDTAAPVADDDDELREALVKAHEALTNVVFDVASLAHGHLEHAREMQADLPPAALPAFFATVPARLFLERLERDCHFDIYSSALRTDPIWPLRVQFNLGKAKLLRRF